MSDWQWRDGNRLDLLVNGEDYFPAVFAAIRAARNEVLIETFILFEDQVGAELESAMSIAVQRGARIELTVDGYGSEKLSDAFVARMQALGIVLRMFEPFPRLFGNRVNLFRRLHHKIVVVDGGIAFVGGINFSEDHLITAGPMSKLDYALRIEGPLVDDIRQLVLDLERAHTKQLSRWQRWRHPLEPRPAAEQKPAMALIARRDNHHHFDDIERLYRIAIRASKHRVIIANAYFFPGYRLLRELTRAAQRGVRVQLIMQGNPDMPVVRFITQTLYAHLARAGIEIFEYCERPIHAKVAVIDEDWSTVGSSNLDPLSLALNLEANVFVADKTFTEKLATELAGLIEHSCKKLEREHLKNPSWWGMVLGFVAFHVTRYFPGLVRSLPAPMPRSRVLSRPAYRVTEVMDEAP